MNFWQRNFWIKNPARAKVLKCLGALGLQPGVRVPLLQGRRGQATMPTHLAAAKPLTALVRRRPAERARCMGVTPWSPTLEHGYQPSRTPTFPG